ncbi:MAG: hypothetical protein M3Q08_01025 [Pseudomonadota bacterium]|nr:hypothetical protein [Pseudomonadota bacterium]
MNGSHESALRSALSRGRGPITAKQHVDTLLRHVDEAQEDIRYFDGRIVNGFGELSDPSYARYYLRRARNQIEEALAALDAAERLGWSREEEA